MQAMLTNRSTVQMPILYIKDDAWHADMLMPGIATLINDDDVTQLTIGKTDPGAAPANPDSAAARTEFLAGIAAMEGRSDAGAAQRVTPLRLLIENYAGEMDVSDGTESLATLNRGDSREVQGTLFELSVAVASPSKAKVRK